MQTLLPELLGETVKYLSLRQFEVLRLSCKRFAAVALEFYWEKRYQYLYELPAELGEARHRELLSSKLKTSRTLWEFIDIIHEIGGMPEEFLADTAMKYLYKLLDILRANKIYHAWFKYEPNYVYVNFYDEIIEVRINHLGMVDIQVGQRSIGDYYTHIYYRQPKKDTRMFNILAALVMEI